MISLRELARKANVSVSTVSRALRDDPAVRGETKRRIQEVARAHDYRPNSVVKGVFTGRMPLIGLINSRLHAVGISRLVEAVIDRANRRGWGCLVYNTHGDPAREAELIGQAISLRASGMIVSTVNYQAGARHFAELARHRIPFVLSTEYSAELAVPHVYCNDRALGREVVDHLHGLGHRHMAVAAGPRASWQRSLRLAGFTERLGDLGLDLPESARAETDWSVESGIEATRRLLRSHPKVTALLCANPNLAIGACAFARQQGIRVPKDLSVVAFGDSQFTRYHSPSLTAVDQRQAAVGERSVDVLFEMMEMEPGSALPRHLLDITLPGELVIRESTGPAPRDGIPFELL